MNDIPDQIISVRRMTIEELRQYRDEHPSNGCRLIDYGDIFPPTQQYDYEKMAERYEEIREMVVKNGVAVQIAHRKRRL